MGLSSVELWQRIAASQLASPLLCRTWAADAAAALSATEAIDGQRVGQQLVNQGKLTQFQIETLLSDDPVPLVRNGYRLLEPVDYAYPPPDVRSVWQGWWAVAKTPTSPTLWMRWILADEFKQSALAQCNPALPRALQQSQLRHERLQSVQPPEMAKGTLQLCVEPVQGRLLSGLCNGQPLSRDDTFKVLTDIASALATLHAAGLAHGRVVPDRICLGTDGHYYLLRDPLCGATMHLPSGKSAAVSGLIASQLPDQLDAVHFLAPEFLLPAQVATPQSDLYSLGCVAWLLLTGQVPHRAKQPELVLAAHAEQSLSAASLAGLPEPLARCLWHCLAKNPAARFERAGQLAEALQEAQRIVARGPSPSAVKSSVVAAKPEAAQPTASTSTTGQVIESKLAATQPKAKLVEPKPPEVKAELKPSESKPVESKPVESKPAESKPAESKPAESKPAESKPLSAPINQEKPAELAAQAAVTAARVVERSESASVPKKSKASPVATEAKPKEEAKPNDETRPQDVVQPVVVAAATPALIQPKVDAVVSSSNAEPSQQPSPTAVAQSSPSPTPQKRLAQPGKPPGRRSPVRKSKKNQRVNWLTPVIGGGALLVLVLVVLVMSGGLGGSSSKSDGTAKNTKPGNGLDQTQDVSIPPVPADPVAEMFELVGDSPTALWAPPHVGQPIEFNLLPPGGQFFACLRPARLMSQPEAKQVLSLLDTDLSRLWNWMMETSGVPLEQIDQAVLAAYPSESGGPQVVWRFKLTEAQPLSQLKTKWSSPVDTKVKEHSLLVSGAKAIYVQQQPLVDSQSVTEFSVGPLEAMREVAEAQGVASAMSGQIEQLRLTTDKDAHINLLVNPVFFYTEGRAWLDQSPPRFRAELEKLATRELRAMMLRTSFSEPWYYEFRLMGATDRDSAVNMQRLSDAKRQLPQLVESWLVSELPHPHWRAMANRFPNMLRAFDTQTRVGAENGQTILNGYLPVAAAPNLVYASWMAFQPGSSAPTGNTVANNNVAQGSATTPLTPEQILDRKITLTIDQTGIENVLQAIGEQANEKLPAGTKPLKFELDGAGFQRSGITRNQQIKDFQVKDQTVRQALFVLSKKGNPVQPLDDLKSDDQKLIWVLIDGANPDKALLSLTSREAAVAAGHKLPAEFVK